ncbi:hypothetical protein CEXT_34121 [Caerostris extrusa]|uniref:Secreted protein n=1 Tax=Caerostris extrusa TaxID=172846 RepID=A0AAV4V1I5_CAEEX|nr:hypothetical protein CEXT_34121 [Caerostris extrusa]
MSPSLLEMSFVVSLLATRHVQRVEMLFLRNRLRLPPGVIKFGINSRERRGTRKEIEFSGGLLFGSSASLKWIRRL